MSDTGFDIIGPPRLIRLNPNIPWKTRGNGALSIKIGIGIGEKIKIGEFQGTNLFCHSESSKEYQDTSRIKEIVEGAIEKYAKFDDKKTNPGFVLCRKKPSFNEYEKRVRKVISIEETKKTLDLLNADYRGYKNSRGLIGATGAISWEPIHDKTYELIAYREKEKWGTKRFVDDRSAKEIDKHCPSTFDNYDYDNKHNRLFPNSPCPILYGIRGGNKKELLKAKSLVKSEKIASWLIFETNQGTDDHLQNKKIKDIQPYESVIVKGKICKEPYTIKGGHVIFTIEDSTGEIDCAAYEPTKQFRKIIRNLSTEDTVKVYGGVREEPLAINVEKINVKKLAKKIEKVENPVCPKCGKHMKSKGANQGYKCVKCGTKSDSPIVKEKNRSISVGFYEVPVCARRHLSKPLKRFKEP